MNLPPAAISKAPRSSAAATGRSSAVDEVQTGFGRTGKLFAFEHWGLEPDLVTVAKSLSGGYVPVGALLMAQQVYDGVFDSLEHSVSHGSTFAPNDLAMAAGLATLRELDDASSSSGLRGSARCLLELTRTLVDEHEVVRRSTRARADVGDGVRRARIRQHRLESDGADAGRTLRSARRRAALHEAPHPEPGRRTRPAGPEGITAARRDEQDLEEFAGALDDVIAKAGRPTRVAGPRAARGTGSLDVGQLGMALADALARPDLRQRDEPFAELPALCSIVRHVVRARPRLTADGGPPAGVLRHLVLLLADDRAERRKFCERLVTLAEIWARQCISERHAELTDI